MKRIVLMLLALALLACVPTPDHEIIENKSEQKDWQVDAVPISEDVLIPLDAETLASFDYEQQDGPLYERLNAPKLFSMENGDFGFSIVAEDCPVYLPNVSAVPAVEAAPRAFTQADVDAVLAVLFPVEGVKWYPVVAHTKESIAEIIREAQEALEQAEPGSEAYDYYKKKLDEKTAYYQELYETAPFAADIKPVEPKLGVAIDAYSSDTAHHLTLHASVADESWLLDVYADDEHIGNSLYASRAANLWTDDEQPLDAPYGVQLTHAEALQQAMDVAERLTGSELAPCCCVPVYFSANDGAALTRRWSQWRVVLMRTFNGVGTAYALEDIGGSMDSAVTRPVAYERLTVDLDDHGVSAITWTQPMRVTGIVQSDATLLSFDDAASKAMQHIAARWKYDVERHREQGDELRIHLRRVTLGLWRIQKKNGGYYFVPVYHFFTEADAENWQTRADQSDGSTPRERFLSLLRKAESGALQLEPGFDPFRGCCMTLGADYWGSVTVNALDGTVIDKDKGY